MKPIDIKAKPYQTPRLEQHANYANFTGVSLPISANSLNPLQEFPNVSEKE